MLSSTFHQHLKLLYSSCLISCIMFLNGCSMVLSSTLLQELRAPTSPIKIDDEEASWIASIPFLVCPIGLLVVGSLTDKIGRRKSLQIAFIPVFIGWSIMIFADSTIMIIVGRFFTGLTTGLMPFVVLYLAEVCPVKHRPLYTSLCNMFVGCGMVSESLLSLFFDWHTVAAILSAVSVAGGVSLFLLPEPPLWLRSKGRTREAEKAEKWFRVTCPPPTATTAEVGGGGGSPSHQNDGNATSAAPSSSFWSVCAQPTVWKPTLILMAFFVCQQGCGFFVVLLYSVDVLRDTAVSVDGSAVTVYLSVSRMAGSVMFSLLHGVKRRTLTVYSGAGMAVSVAMFVGYLEWYAGVEHPPNSDFVTVAFVLYVFFSMLAIMPLPWVLSGEVFPMAVKGKMCAIVNVFGYEVMFLVCKIYPEMSSTYGIINIWSIFAGFCVLTAIFGAFIMPETKGKSLDEILKSFDSNNSTKNNLTL